MERRLHDDGRLLRTDDRVQRAHSRAQGAERRASAFRYRDYGTLATIGRKAAVVDVGPFRLGGRVAWWFWVLAHLFFLIGFRNRLAVMLNWALSYYSRQRYARIIVSDSS